MKYNPAIPALPFTSRSKYARRDYGTLYAKPLPKAVQEARRKYLLDHADRLYYEKRTYNGDQYV